MTTIIARYFIEGSPAPQGSKRHVGRGVMVEMSKNLPQWRKTVAWATRAQVAQLRITEPRREATVALGFILARPKTHYDSKGRIRVRYADVRPTTRPDLDKLTRAVFDGLTQGGILEDDARVHTLIATKRYVNPDLDYPVPGCWVVIEP